MLWMESIWFKYTFIDISLKVRNLHIEKDENNDIRKAFNLRK